MPSPGVMVAVSSAGGVLGAECHPRNSGRRRWSELTKLDLTDGERVAIDVIALTHDAHVGGKNDNVISRFRSSTWWNARVRIMRREKTSPKSSTSLWMQRRKTSLDHRPSSMIMYFEGSSPS